MFSIGDEDIKQLESDLKTFAERAFPFATKNTVNQSAFTAMKIARDDLKERFTLRNRFSIQSIQVEQTKTLNVKRQAAIVGSTADYMEDQEFGAVKVSTTKEGIAIATSYSAGQKGQKRTRLPRRANKLNNIQLKKRKKRTAKNRKQALLFKVQDAVESGDRYIFHDFGRRKGVLKVNGGRKGFKRGWPKGASLQMVWDMTRKSVVIPKNPWLMPAVKETQKKIPDIYKRSLIFQLKRLDLFKS